MSPSIASKLFRILSIYVCARYISLRFDLKVMRIDVLFLSISFVRSMLLMPSLNAAFVTFACPSLLVIALSCPLLGVFGLANGDIVFFRSPSTSSKRWSNSFALAPCLTPLR